MLDQRGNAEDFDAYFTASGVGKTGLTVTVNVYGPDGTIQVSNASATEVAAGFYTYQLPGSFTTGAGNYRAVFSTTDSSVDQKSIPYTWTIGKTWVQNSDTTVSSRSGGDPWAAVIPASYAAGTAGSLLGYAITPYSTTTVTANTLTLATWDSLLGADLTGYQIVVERATTGAGQTALITSSDTETNVQTFAAGWSRGITPTGTIQYSYWSPNIDRTGYQLASTGLDAVQVEAGMNARQALSAIAAFSAGALSGAGSGTIIIDGAGVSTQRIRATTDSSGNRTSITLSLPA